MEVFTQLDNAITLKPISDPILVYSKTSFEKARTRLSDELMKNVGVQDSELAKSLGLFGMVLVCLITLLALYFLFKNCICKRDLC